MFRHGLIAVSTYPAYYAKGQAFAGKEENRPDDLYIDFRGYIKEMQSNLPPEMVNPYSIKIESLRQDARNFSKKFPKAKFAVLRLWSAAHFYPLMVGGDNRHNHSFIDAISRVWEWKFMSKDMPFSEYSMHANMVVKLKPLQQQLGRDGDKIKIRKDVMLIMGKDEEELLRLTAATTFTIQTRPWRLEIDFWKSFVNIDVGFLESLHEQWWS